MLDLCRPRVHLTGVCSETLPIKKWRIILTPKPSTAEQVTI